MINAVYKRLNPFRTIHLAEFFRENWRSKSRNGMRYKYAGLILLFAGDDYPVASGFFSFIQSFVSSTHKFIHFFTVIR